MGRDHSGWANIPDDLLQDIVSRTTFVIDHIRCRAVCRNWNQMSWNWKGDELPWLMFYLWNRKCLAKSICKVYVPSHQKMYTVLNGGDDQERRRKVAHVATLDHSMDGWLVFRHWKKHIVFLWKNYLHLSLYCPFSDKVINLPCLQTNCRPIRVSFTSNPTASDCLFFVVLPPCSPNSSGLCKIQIGTCRAGDRTWKFKQFGWLQHQMRSILNVAYFDGTFYCLFSCGTLGAFHFATEELCLLITRSTEEDWRYGKLVASRDEQLLCVYQLKGESSLRAGRFDLSRKKWMREETGFGEDISVFLNSYNAAADTVVARGVREMGNSVHSYNSWTQKFYVQKFGDIKQNSEVYSTDKVSAIKEALQSGLEPMWIAPFSTKFSI